MLLPHLDRACNGHLGAVHWFRADWQRGGAATGRATWTTASGETIDAMVKFPIRARELLWMRRLQQPEGHVLPVVPRLFASGSSLESYDLAWIVIEWLPHGPLGKRWHVDHVKRTAQAIARFYQESDQFPVEAEKARREDWNELVDNSLRSVSRNHIEAEEHWQSLLRQLERHLPEMVTRWRARDKDHWIHADLHLANALSRDGAEKGDVTLIDLAEVRPGHWLEDAVYLERRLWALPARLIKAKPVAAIRQARRAFGLAAETDFEALASIRRALMAATAPAFMKTEGHPRFLAACREQLEKAMSDFERS